MARKGELSRGRLDREYPHHVALPAEKVRDVLRRPFILAPILARARSPTGEYVRQDLAGQ